VASEETVEKAKVPSRKKLQAKLRELNEEYRLLGSEASAGNSAALNRRSELARELRALSETLYLREPDVDVDVPRSATGHPFRLGDLEFRPGRHKVKASTAQYLLWLIYKNREDELNRLRQNGETVDLGAIGEKASMSDREL
jgi:hypothetical protein